MINDIYWITRAQPYVIRRCQGEEEGKAGLFIASRVKTKYIYFYLVGKKKKKIFGKFSVGVDGTATG